MPPVSELTFRRTAINLRDAARLGEGEDLNDALLDFFVKLWQSLIPAGGDDKAPVAYLGSLFFKQLTSAFSTSGEEGWKHVANWAKRKAQGLFKTNYAAFSVPINEELKDEKGQEAGNHWWLALLLNPPGGARGEPTAVMVLDSMQRREKHFTEPTVTNLKGARGYTMEVTKMEQAGYLIIITFIAKGDGSAGPLQRPESSKLYAGDIALLNPELGLKINMGGSHGVSGCYEGTLTFGLDGRVRTSSFRLDYGEGGYSIIPLEFDPFVLTKMQKNVSRYLGGYLCKEWETNGPEKKKRFEKQSARALVADVYQQENLNDCGVFVLENTLRSLSMSGEFLKSMSGASSQVLRSFPWPSQEDITKRKEKLKDITARLFAAAADAGTSDVDVLLKGDATLREEVLGSLTDIEARRADLNVFAGSLQKELAARQQDKEATDAEKKKKEEAAQVAKMENKMRKEEEERQKHEDYMKGVIKAKPKISKRQHVSTSESRSRSRSRSPPRKKQKAEKKTRSESKDKSEDAKDDRRRTQRRDKSEDADDRKRQSNAKEKSNGKPDKAKEKSRRNASRSKSRSASPEVRDRRRR